MSCPSFETLIDYADTGRRGSEEIQAHLTGGCAATTVTRR